MKKLGISLVFAVVLLTGCDHHKSANQAQSEAGTAAVAQNDSDLTGQPAPTSGKVYPKAIPVSSPPDSPSTASSSPPSADAITTPLPTPAPPAEPTNVPTPVTTTPNPPTPEKETAQQQVVVVETSFGSIVIELDNFAAPKTCENFRKLVSTGFYNHTAFHRVIPNFIIQGGDPNSTSDDRTSYGQGGPGYTLAPEIKLTHDSGAVAMARLPDSVNPQRESNGSQFYICLVPCPSLDEQYTVFGHVIKGMDVAIEIANQPRDQRDNPLNRIEMEASLEPKDKALADGTTGNP